MSEMDRLHASAAIALAFVTVFLPGCAAIDRFPASRSATQNTTAQAAAKTFPRVQECGVLNTGTPSRFVCDGKVYTSFQLAKLREDKAKTLPANK